MILKKLLRLSFRYAKFLAIMKTSPVNMDVRKNLDMRAGDTIRVHQKIADKGGKTRIQIFEGMVLARKHGSEAGGTFTVRRVTNGYGVEKIFPLYSPMIEKIEITKRSKVRRAKLYHIRKTALKQVSKRLKMMFVDFKTEEPVEEPVVEEAPAENPGEKTEDNTDAPTESAESTKDKKEETPEKPEEEVKEEKTDEEK
jgi:large subunit ribosomal protein L19